MTRDLTILGCSSQQHTRNRNHGAYILRWHGDGLLFDPGEGTQRQFIHANIAPTVVNRIFISHFHGDHCLGLGSILMRLNLDHVDHEIHCYYPKSGEKFFNRLRYSAIYHSRINVIEHQVDEDGLVHSDDLFDIYAYKLEHKIDNYAWKIQEKDKRKFYKDKLDAFGIKGILVKQLMQNGYFEINGKKVSLDEVSWIRKGDIFSVVIDTKVCNGAKLAANGAKLLLSESTYTSEHEDLAKKNYHMTSKEAATLAKDNNVEKLVLTHFSARYNDERVFLNDAKKVFKDVTVARDLLKITF